MEVLNSTEGLLKELKEAGHNFETIHEIFKQRVLTPQVVEIILKWIGLVYEESLGSGDQLVRSLIAAKNPYNPSVLVNLFENSSFNEAIKWGIAHVLSVSNTYDISEWIIDQLLNKPGSFERNGLIGGLVKKSVVKDRDKLMKFLRLIFDKYCYFENYQKLFQKYANSEDIAFLKEKLLNPDLKYYIAFAKAADLSFGEDKAKNADKRYEREIKKMIENIEKRKKEPLFKI